MERLIIGITGASRFVFALRLLEQLREIHVETRLVIGQWAQVHRAADVVLKERRRQVLVIREAPLNEIHIVNILKSCRMGCTILPPVPGIYNFLETALDIVDHVARRILDLFGLAAEDTRRWDVHMWGGNKIQRVEATLNQGRSDERSNGEKPDNSRGQRPDKFARHP